MALIDIDKFVASIMYRWNNPEMKTIFNDMKYSLIDQGLEYKEGEIVKSQRRVSAEAKENGYGESDDERIRKAISIYLDWLNGRKDCAPRGEYSIRDMIAWLEKQGKHKSAWTETDDEEFEIAINALKGAGQYDFAAWLITLKKRK